RSDPALGRILTDADGRTVYKYDQDTKGASSCTGACAQNWPPVQAAADPKLAGDVKGTLGTLNRADGIKQVMYDDTPLYRFAGDASATDAKGDGVGGVWHAVHPEA